MIAGICITLGCAYSPNVIGFEDGSCFIQATENDQDCVSNIKKKKSVDQFGIERYTFTPQHGDFFQFVYTDEGTEKVVIANAYSSKASDQDSFCQQLLGPHH